jgi:glycerol-3-phosphate acyltransferase PlsY
LSAAGNDVIFPGMEILAVCGVAIGAFLAGGIPFSWLLGKVAGFDLRREGSGNPGATNLYRTAGPAWGITGLLLDVAKGFLPVLAARWLFPEVEAAAIVAAAAAIAGHIWTPYLGFRGGKGVATATGAFLAINPLVLLIAVGAFAIVVAATRYVSLGSMIGAVVAFVVSFWLPLLEGRPVDPYFVAFCGVCAASIIVAHRKNIGRLISGTEGKFGARAKNDTQDQKR